MKQARYLFAGDRPAVLNRMLEMGLNVTAIFLANNFFQKDALKKTSLPIQQMGDKQTFLQSLQGMEFDVLVSNGCPHILPVSQIKQPHQQFINVHASLLPEFRGPHPVNAALLHGKDGGATCHHMHDTVDSGEIISQIRIPLTDDVDLGLLFLLTTLAEADCFEQACQRDFAADGTLPNTGGSYFTYDEAAMRLDFSAPTEALVRQVRAFGIFSQGAHFEHNGHAFKVYDAEACRNPYLSEKFSNARENEVIFVYDSTVVLKKGDGFVKLKIVQTESGSLQAGEVLSPLP